MRYSEAIRLGSMLYPQGDQLIRVSMGAVSVCANGAAAIALGMTLADLGECNGELAPEAVFDLSDEETLIRCPACLHNCAICAVALCAHLNDEHDWTRERIADWLAASGHDFEIDLNAKPECAPAAEPVATGVAE